MTLALFGYRALTGLISPALPLLLKQRVAKGKEDPDRTQERLGYASRKRPDGQLIWLHGASIGESQVLLLLFDALKAARPELQAVITTQTITSAELIARRNAGGLIHQMAPLDTPFATERFLKHWQPDLAVFAEGDIWPNMLTKLDAKRIPRLLVNARMTEKSFDGWLRYAALAEKLFGGFETVLAANQRTADGLARFTRKRLRMSGNIKYAAPPLSCDNSNLANLSEIVNGRPVVAAVSTHPGEEEMIARVVSGLSDGQSSPLLIIAPRHPERGPAIAEALQSGSKSVYLRSRDAEPRSEQNIWICDTLGEIGLWMRLANVVFLGGGQTGADIHGHNPIEPLKLDRFVISFPDVSNFKQEFSDLVSADAAQLVDTEAALADALAPWISGSAGYAPNQSRLKPYLEGRTALDAATEAVLASLSRRRSR